MIANALTLINNELTAYVNGILPAAESVEVIADNIANFEQDANTLSDKIIITLVNVEEESVFKNGQPYRKPNAVGGLDYVNPPVYLNLYLLFCCTLSAQSDDRYLIALERLSLVIQFFQKKRFFTIHNSPMSVISEESAAQNIQQLKVIMDLYTLTFEQLNHLWGSLGGKQVPSVMYKARLVKIQDEQVQGGGGMITEIQSREEIH